MPKRRHIAICFLAFCLTATLLVGVTSSAEYDPWCDMDDNGLIDIVDLVSLAIRFGEEGTPINKTELLFEVNATYSKLLSQIKSLNASLANLQDRVKSLETGGFIGTPAFDNETQISQGEEKIFTHNLNTTEVFVYMIGRYDGASPYIHQIDYGGLSDYQGARWKDLTNTTIRVIRRSNDNNWNYVRVMIWKVLS